MPRVGNKRFPYTPAGIKAANKARKKAGMKTRMNSMGTSMGGRRKKR